MSPLAKLRAIKAVHTAVWAVFAGAILAIPVCAARGERLLAWSLIGLVLIEVAVLAGNGMRCPLTDLARRYTAAREDNFDIYLPLWLARHNQTIFGALYLAGLAFTLWLTVRAAS